MVSAEAIQTSRKPTQATKKRTPNQLGPPQNQQQTNTKVTQRNERRGFSLPLDDDLVLFGRVDGIDEASRCVVEHKQRRNGLFRRVRDYENAQLQAYMALTSCTAARLVETYGDNQLVHSVPFDAEMWNDHARLLVKRVDELRQIIDSENPSTHRTFFASLN